MDIADMSFGDSPEPEKTGDIGSPPPDDDSADKSVDVVQPEQEIVDNFNEEDKQTPAESDADAAPPEDAPEEPEGDGDDGDADAADAPEATALSPDVLIAAGQAGLDAETVASLGSDAAVRAAIKLVQSRAAANEGGSSQEQDTEPEPPFEMPELPAWEDALPEEVKADLEPHVAKYLEDQNARMKTFVEAMQGFVETASKQPKPSGTDDGYSAADLSFDMVMNDLVAKHPEYKDAVGEGFLYDLPDDAYAARAKVAGVMKELRQNHTGSSSEMALQAARIVFRDIDTKAQKRALTTRVKSRQKQRVQKPASTQRDSLSPREKAIRDVADMQQAAGIQPTDNNGVLVPF